jgi:hypothetical protein
MLKMYANGKHADGKPVRLVVFGLSHNNLDELRKGRPITFNGATAGLDEDIEFLIFSDASERVMHRKFQELIGPETEVHIDPRLLD